MLGRKLSNIIKRLTTNNLLYFEEQFLYGHREILLNYCMHRNSELSGTSILEGSIDHGFAFQENIWKLRKRNLTSAQRYVWNERQKGAYRGDKSVSDTGSAWLYLLNDLGLTPENIRERLKKNPKKVIILPSHNTGIHFKYSIVESLENYLPYIPSGSDVVVCLYWIDFCDPSIRRAIGELGWKVASNGWAPRLPVPDLTQGGRQNFLLEFFALFNDATLTLTDNFSSGLLYALSLDAEVTYIPSKQFKELDRIGNQAEEHLKISELPGFFPTEELWVKHHLPQLIETKVKSRKFLDFAWDELGYKSFLKNEDGAKFKWIESGAEPSAIYLYQKRLESLKELYQS